MRACTGTRDHGMRLRVCCCVCGLCWCSLSDNGIDDAGAADVGAGLVHLPLLQTLKYVCTCLCVHGAAVCVCTGMWGNGAVAMCCGLWWCRLVGNLIGVTGAAAICTGLVHSPQLRTLLCVVCPAVRTGSWCALAPERGQWHAFALAFLCARSAILQPWKQLHRSRGCRSRWCRLGPLAPAADTGVRCVSGCVYWAVVCGCTEMCGVVSCF